MVLETTRVRIVILGRLGFSAKCIQEKVRYYDGEKVSLSKIYAVLAYEGIRLKDYRDGINPETKKAMAVAGVSKKRISLAG